MRTAPKTLLIGCLLLASACLHAQQLPNCDFEEWTLVKGSGAYKDYEEPSGGVWSSGNGVIHVAAGAQPVLEKTTDAHRGAFAAKLTTRKVFGQVASGSLFTGSFSLNLAKPVESARLGVPFITNPITPKPTAFRGWFKYLPAGNDSSSLYARLWRWNDITRSRELIAQAYLTQRNAVTEWTEFNVPFFVFNPLANTDTIALVFSSSAGGGNFKGDEGSILYVDDVSLSYDAVSVREDGQGGKEEWCRVASTADGFEMSVLHGSLERVVVTDLRGCVVVDRVCGSASSTSVNDVVPGPYIIALYGTTTSGERATSTSIQPFLP